MQDLQPPLFAAVERRLRPLGHHHLHPQVLKCPRCDSTNTKFCYYNNYNLSQPRHFCKSCRRYWTKGGVLRNVPVGGGCRKSTKRPKPSPPTAPPEAEPAPDSSSEGSSLAATAALPDTREHEPLLPDPVPGGASLHALQDACRQPQWQGRGHEGLGGLFDPTVQMDLPGMGCGGFGPSDWQMKDHHHHHQGVYDLPTAVDQAYWSHEGQSQWTDHDHQGQYPEPLPPLNFSQFLY